VVEAEFLGDFGGREAVDPQCQDLPLTRTVLTIELFDLIVRFRQLEWTGL
jgi:hypothetical protein